MIYQCEDCKDFFNREQLKEIDGLGALLFCVECYKEELEQE